VEGVKVGKFLVPCPPRRIFDSWFDELSRNDAVGLAQRRGDAEINNGFE